MLADVLDSIKSVWSYHHDSESEEWLSYSPSAPSDLKEMMEGKDWRGNTIDADSWNRTDAWWDIDNDVMFTFGKNNAKKILKALRLTRDKKKSEQAEGWY